MSIPDRRETGRLTVAGHELFIQSLLTPADYDEIDEALVEPDPVIERCAPRRQEKQVRRVLELLDNLDGRDG